MATITVSRTGDKLVWQAAQNIPAGAEVVVTENCQALLIGDGVCVDCLYPGKHQSINLEKKGIFSKKPLYASCSILGVDTSQPTEIPWGVGDVTYTDTKTGFNGEIKANGSVTVKIFDGRMLYRGYFDGENAVDKNFLKTTLRFKFCKTVTNVFQQVANTLSDETAIKSHNFETAIKDALKKTLRNSYGLETEDVTCTINSTGMEDYKDRENTAKIAGLDAKVAAATADGMKSMAEGIKSFGTTPEEKKEEKKNIIKLKRDEEDR